MEALVSMCAESEDDMAALEARILKHRESIRSGEFEIAAESDSTRTDAKRARRLRATLFIDGERIRADYYREDRASGAKYRESFGFAEKALNYYSNQSFADGGHVRSTIQPPEAAFAQNHPVPDPRLAGMAAAAFENLINYKLNSIVGRRIGVLRSRVEPAAELRGMKCRKIIYEREDGETAVWVAIERDYNVIRIESKFDDVELRCDSELEMVPGFGWFPSRVAAERMAGGKLTRSDSYTIKVRQVNQPVPLRTFGFEGMDVPEGTMVYDYRDANLPRAWVLQSGKLEADLRGTQSDAASRPRSPTPASKRTNKQSMILLASGVCFSLLAIIVLARGIRRKTYGP